MSQAAQPFVEYPVLQVRPNTLLVYTRREWNPVLLDAAKSRKAKEREQVKREKAIQADMFQKQRQSFEQLAIMNVSKSRSTDDSSPLENFRGRKAYSGTITEQSRKRMRRAINLLIAQAQWKTAIDFKTGKEYKFLINFITLTLPSAQGHRSDKLIKSKVLDPWIKKARRRFKLKSYVWRAERQGNGNIHFHFATDTFINYNELRDTWNDNLEALGFISEFEKSQGHRHPNSTDVHAVKNVNNLAGYILKYMSKEVATKSDLATIRGAMFAHGTNARRKAAKAVAAIVNLSDVPLDGKVWDCSTNLKIKTNCELFLEGEAEKIWSEERERNPEKVTDGQRFSFIVYKRSTFNRMLRGPIKRQWDDYLQVIRSKAVEVEATAKPPAPPPPPEVDCPF